MQENGKILTDPADVTYRSINTAFSAATLRYPLDGMAPGLGYLVDSGQTEYLAQIQDLAAENCQQDDQCEKFGMARIAGHLAEIVTVMDGAIGFMRDKVVEVYMVNGDSLPHYPIKIPDDELGRLQRAVEANGGSDVVAPSLGMLACEFIWQSELAESCRGFKIFTSLSKFYSRGRISSPEVLAVSTDMHNQAETLTSYMVDADNDKNDPVSRDKCLAEVRGRLLRFASRNKDLAEGRYLYPAKLSEKLTDFTTWADTYRERLKAGAAIVDSMKKIEEVVLDGQKQRWAQEEIRKKAERVEQVAKLQAEYDVLVEPFKPMSGKRLRSSVYQPLFSALTGHQPSVGSNVVLKDGIDKVAAGEIIGLLRGIEPMLGQDNTEAVDSDTFRQILDNEVDITQRLNDISANSNNRSMPKQLSENRSLADRVGWLARNWSKVRPVLDAHWSPAHTAKLELTIELWAEET